MIWKKLGTIRDPNRLRPWLVSVAVNEAKKLMSKRRRRAEIEVAADATGEPGGIDRIRSSQILLGEPIVGQMQIDLGR